MKAQVKAQMEQGSSKVFHGKWLVYIVENDGRRFLQAMVNEREEAAGEMDRICDKYQIPGEVVESENSEVTRPAVPPVLALVVVGLLLGLLLAVVVANTTLFEDGSIQFFNRAGWGFCFLRAWGCA